MSTARRGGGDVLADLVARNLAGLAAEATRWESIRTYVIFRDGPVCRICGLGIRRGFEVVDHITPFSWGGSNRPENLRVVHQFCNNSRGPHRNGRLYTDEEVRRSHEHAIRLGQPNVLRGLS